MTLEQRVEAMEKKIQLKNNELHEIKSQLTEIKNTISCGQVSSTYSIRLNREGEDF